MTIKQIIEKKQKLKMCTKTKLAHIFTLRELVKFIGNVVVFIETVPYRKLLFCRQYLLNLFNRIKVILKQKLNLHIFLKRSSFGGKTKLTTIYIDENLDGKAAVSSKSETGDMWTNQEAGITYKCS